MAVFPSPQKRLGTMPIKPPASPPNLEKMPGIIRTPSPVGTPNLEHMPSIKKNNTLAARQRKMVDAIKANKGKMSNKSKLSIQQAAIHRKRRKSGSQRKLFSGSIG